MLSINEKNKTARNWRFIIVINVFAFRLVKKQRSIFGNIKDQFSVPLVKFVPWYRLCD